MSTTTIPFVRSVIAASTAAGSRLSVCGSTSANTGTPPSKMKQFAVATKATGDVITSSPGSTPAMWQSMGSPAVPPAPPEDEAVRRRAEGDRGCDPLVPRLHTGDVAEHVQPRRPARDRGRVRCADALGQQLLETLDRRPQREAARAQDV